MVRSKSQEIKHAQRESFLYQQLTNFFVHIARDDKRVRDLFITRTKLSSDKGTCTVFFHSPFGEQDFKEKLPILILYKPSIRSSLAKISHSRYTPNLIFRYDTSFDKQQKLEMLMEKLKREGKL